MHGLSKSHLITSVPRHKHLRSTRTHRSIGQQPQGRLLLHGTILFEVRKLSPRIGGSYQQLLHCIGSHSSKLTKLMNEVITQPNLAKVGMDHKLNTLLMLI